MAPVTNARVLFAAVPQGAPLATMLQTDPHRGLCTGFPIPGETTVYDTSQTIDLEGAPLNGGFLIKTLVLSIDPYMRGKMRAPEKESYSVRILRITRISPIFHLSISLLRVPASVHTRSAACRVRRWRRSTL
jgi:hypothetical protein